MHVVLLCLCCLPCAVLARDYFTAAVFEHRPAYVNNEVLDPEQIKRENLEYYDKAIALAAQKGADIILVNEYGTFVNPTSRERIGLAAEYVPDPRKYAFNPCVQGAKDRAVLYRISCLARRYKIYAVVNMFDVKKCEKSRDCNCPEDGRYLYNTDVAFDREGNLIARYHKMHPYFEAVDMPKKTEFITFNTDFGKFGMVVCFDMVFDNSVKLVTEYGIDTLLFPTYWFDDIAPLVGVEFQQAFAVANGVNVIGANTHVPGTGSLGSGIYTRDDGALVYSYEPNGLNKLLLANIGIKPGAKVPNVSSVIAITKNKNIRIQEDGQSFPEQCYEPVVGPPRNIFKDYRCNKLKVENYTTCKLEDPSGVVTACSRGFCCKLTYSAEDMKEDFYLAAFNGLDNIGGFYEWWEETCVVTRCDPLGGSPCVLQPATSKTVFKTAVLEASFKSDVVYPAVTQSRMRLAPKKEWDFERTGANAKLTYKAQSRVPLLRLTLLGRIFKRDPPFEPFSDF